MLPLRVTIRCSVLITPHTPSFGAVLTLSFSTLVSFCPTSNTMTKKTNRFTCIIHVELLWVLTRDRKPCNEVTVAALSVIEQNGLSQSQLGMTDQSDCEA